MNGYGPKPRFEYEQYGPYNQHRIKTESTLSSQNWTSVQFPAILVTKHGTLIAYSRYYTGTPGITPGTIYLLQEFKQ